MTNGNSLKIAREIIEAILAYGDARADKNFVKGTTSLNKSIELIRAALSVCADGGKGEAVAWRIFDGEGNYDYVEDEPSECNVNYAARYGRKYEPLFTAPQAECAPRADADTEGAKLNEAAWASDDHVEFPGRLIATPASSAGASERADAEKDAALTESDISRIWLKTTGTYASDCPWDVHGFARAILVRSRLTEALLDAERAREERNREHVRLNAEWMAKCEELRKDAERWNMNIQLMRRKHSQQAINEVIAVVDAAMAKKEGA